MNDSPDQRNLHNANFESRFDQPPKKLVLSALLGFCIGVLIAGGIVVLARVMESETDGMRALTHGLAILVPALILLGLVWIVRRNAAGGLSLTATSFFFLVGIACGGAIWVTSPTQFQMTQELARTHHDLFVKRATQLANCRDQMEAIPPGELKQRITADQMADLKIAEMDFRKSHHETYNAWLTAVEDFSRLKIGTDPDTIMDRYDIPDAKFNVEDRYRYSSGSDVDDLAGVAFGSTHLWHDELEDLIHNLKQLRYVVIVRMINQNSPQLAGNQFIYGYAEGEAFCFDLQEDEKLLAAFRFATTNKDEVSFRFLENADEFGKSQSAANSIREDLFKNTWTAFWHRFHELAENAKSAQQSTELPYKPITLAEAMLIWQQQVANDKRRKHRVMAEIENIDDLPINADFEPQTDE